MRDAQDYSPHYWESQIWFSEVFFEKAKYIYPYIRSAWYNGFWQVI